MKNWHYGVLTLGLIVFFALFSVRLNEPWLGHFEGPSIWMASSIKVYNNFGMDSVNYLPVRPLRVFGPTSPETTSYYLHHPPVIVWLSTVATWLFGYYPNGAPFELTFRVLGNFLTVISMALLYAIARRVSNPKAALIAFFIYGLTPLTVYYSRGPYYDMVMMPFALAYAYVFLRWMKQFTMRDTRIMLLLAIVIMWIAWAGAFFIAAFGFLAFIMGTKQQRVWMFLIGVVSLVATIAVPAFYQALNPEAVQQLVRIFLFRTGNQVAITNSLNFTTAEFMARWLYDWLTILSPAMTIFGLWGLIRFGFKRNLNSAFLLALFLGPLAFLLVFRNAFFFHDWYEIHFMPALAVAGGMLVYHLWQLEPKGLARYAKPLVVAIAICSLGISIFWTINLHLVEDPFVYRLIEELPLHTTADDYIASNSFRPYDEAAYYAERNVNWGIPESSLEEYMALEDRQPDFYFLYCDFEDERPDDSFADTSLLDPYPSVVIADVCRLYHISDPQ